MTNAPVFTRALENFAVEGRGGSASDLIELLLDLLDPLVEGVHLILQVGDLHVLRLLIGEQGIDLIGQPVDTRRLTLVELGLLSGRPIQSCEGAASVLLRNAQLLLDLTLDLVLTVRFILGLNADHDANYADDQGYCCYGCCGF